MVGMADLIDRQAAIDAVRSYYDEQYALCDSIEELIEKLPSANQWISCSERLPENWKKVLVFFKAGRKCPHDRIQVGHFGTHEVEDEWFEIIDNVTVLYTDKYYYPLDAVAAWMPLPEPWGGDKDD